MFAHEPGENRVPAGDPSEHGTLILHRETCALPNGNRQTITFHVAPPGDSKVAPLPRISLTQQQDLVKDGLYLEKYSQLLQEYKDQRLNGKHPANVINQLKPTGELFCAIRGKELVILVGEYAIRISFGTEGHAFWLPTKKYQQIIALPTVKRGEKGTAFQVPSDYIIGPERTEPLKISIQAAFVRPQWTLLFVDHQVFITFHVMRLWRCGTAKDLKPGSEQLYARLWSRSHGPVFSSEPSAALDALEAFRAEIVAESNSDPIWVVMKHRQDAFNGFGAQETCDTLLTALIHPRMPAYLVCQDSVLWGRLLKAVREDHLARVSMATRREKPFPRLSSKTPFRFNDFGHKRFLQHVTCYRRDKVIFTPERLALANSLGLFDPNVVLGDDGVARIPLGFTADQSVTANFAIKQSVRPDCKSVTVPNYGFQYPKFKNESSTELVTMYSPFICQLPKSWPAHDHVVENIIDVTKCVNDTTLGPYLFQVFVDVAWSTQHVEKAKQTIGPGRRATLVVGNANIKRPKKNQIPTGQSARSQAKCFSSISTRYQPVSEGGDEENSLVGGEDILEDKSTNGGRVLRSSSWSKLTLVNHPY
ncbi:fatty acid synthase alpha subunit Lsd1 [Marasmius crinis-equi]|uniref:Fatty acid synthase alpha subunit Lsd1 n=1 Tax=Marasmius crinis-equi TaxID=585013 RepID=A0ABR3EWS0_9AGAR